jgi:hypothetical protein
MGVGGGKDIHAILFGNDKKAPAFPQGLYFKN